MVCGPSGELIFPHCKQSVGIASSALMSETIMGLKFPQSQSNLVPLFRDKDVYMYVSREHGLAKVRSASVNFNDASRDESKDDLLSNCAPNQANDCSKVLYSVNSGRDRICRDMQSVSIRITLCLNPDILGESGKNEKPRTTTNSLSPPVFKAQPNKIS